MVVTRQGTMTDDSGEGASSGQTMQQTVATEPRIVEVAETPAEETQDTENPHEEGSDMDIDVNLMDASGEEELTSEHEAEQGAVRI